MTLGRASAGFANIHHRAGTEGASDKVGEPSFLEAWLGLGAYTIQVYFDFAGYSNMAIGLGLALGIPFPNRLEWAKQNELTLELPYHRSIVEDQDDGMERRDAADLGRFASHLAALRARVIAEETNASESPAPPMLPSVWLISG